MVVRGRTDVDVSRRRSIMTKWIAALALSGALAFAAPSTAEAQGPIVTGGLVNVTITDFADIEDVLTDFNIGVNAAVALAAAVCDVDVDVISAAIENTGAYDCAARTGRQRVFLEQDT